MPSRNILETLFEKRPVGVELFARLVEISPVCRQGSLVVCDDCSARRSREARDEFATCVARSYVLGLM